MNAFASFSTPLCTARSTRFAVCRSVLSAVGVCWALTGAALPSLAADAAVVTKPPVKAATKPAAKKAKPAAAKKAPPAEVAVIPATDEQRSAAEWVHYGEYQCEFKQVVQIAASERFPAYVDLRVANASYLMKPVLSSTGAIRLEDVRGQTLMIQIANKSMLMNVKTGTRLVDECISPRHRAQIEAAKQAAELEAAQAAAKPAP